MDTSIFPQKSQKTSKRLNKREQKLLFLQKQIEKGEYRIKPSQIADKILHTHKINSFKY